MRWNKWGEKIEEIAASACIKRVACECGDGVSVKKEWDDFF